MLTTTFRTIRGNERTDEVWTAATKLFSEHYGTWGPGSGRAGISIPDPYPQLRLISSRAARQARQEATPGAVPPRREKHLHRRRRRQRHISRPGIRQSLGV